jgi:hypothetical protein
MCWLNTRPSPANNNCNRAEYWRREAGMNAELLYHYLMDSAVLFLSGWLVLLVGAFTLSFRKTTN